MNTLCLFIFILYSITLIFGDKWIFISPTGPQLSPRYLHTAVISSENNVFIFGGRDSNFNVFNDVGIFDPQINIWIPLNITGEVPSQRFGSSSVLSSNNRVLVFFGTNGTDCFNDVYQFDLQLNAWISIEVGGITPTPRFSSSNVVYNNLVIFFGGSSNSELLNSTLKFNLSSNSWETINLTGSTIPPSRRDSVSVPYLNNMIVFGGEGVTSLLNDLYSFNIDTEIWTQLFPTGTPPTPRTGMTAIISSSTLIIFGGTNFSLYFNDVCKYDIITNTWENVSSIPNAPPKMAYRSATFVILSSSLNSVILFGGFNGSVAVNRIDNYEISSFISQQTAQTPSLLVLILSVVLIGLFIFGILGILISLFCCRKVTAKKKGKSERKRKKLKEESEQSEKGQVELNTF